ncbi:hypothetical protein ACEZ3J_003244 [Escherichia coli]|nr:hypothetical protein [Salmonella enterica]
MNFICHSSDFNHAGWLVGWLAGWLVGWLAGWLVSLCGELSVGDNTPPVPCLVSLTPGDFPDGNRGCHASHRASCAVSARPLRGSGFPSQAVAISLAASVNGCAALARRYLRFPHPGGKAAGL